MADDTNKQQQETNEPDGTKTGSSDNTYNHPRPPVTEFWTNDHKRCLYQRDRVLRESKNLRFGAELFVVSYRTNILTFSNSTYTKCEFNYDLSGRNVRHILEIMSKLNCPQKVENCFECRVCEGDVQGGFNPDDKQVILCENKLGTYPQYENTLLHELIHAFDDCRAKLDWSNCLHQACSEVRAAHLSGDCHIGREVVRGHLNIIGQHMECVKRRAEKSVNMNPKCDGRSMAAVEAVLAQCIADMEPFNKRP
eukprot:GEZU01022798.1.p1 GENE.GEZU01022798.1~~GEZU01022798.1.p1  ORF type:complete len:252 (+),score=2.34 GEZU01022798.1:122-877(+)